MEKLTRVPAAAAGSVAVPPLWSSTVNARVVELSVVSPITIASNQFAAASACGVTSIECG